MAHYIGKPAAGTMIYEFDVSSGSITLDLDAIAVAGLGKEIYVIKTDNSANTVTIQPANGETIDGNANKVLTTENELVHLLCIAGEWKTI